jgi:PAS domain-containing protein
MRFRVAAFEGGWPTRFRFSENGRMTGKAMSYDGNVFRPRRALVPESRWFFKVVLMTDNKLEGKFEKQPSWERVRRTLALGGLGFWRLARRSADDVVIFDPDDTFLTAAGLKRGDMPRSLDQFLAKYLFPEDAEAAAEAIRGCFAGDRGHFSLEHRLRRDETDPGLWLRTFGEAEPRDPEGLILAISGGSQNIQEHHEARTKLEAAAAEKEASFERRMADRIQLLEMQEADERMRIMFDAMPLACNFWDANRRNMDCNQASAILFDLPDQKAYLDNFYKLSPEFQPDGRPSGEKAVAMVDQAFRDGRIVFEWMHQKLDGAPVPCEIILVRMPWRDDFIVVGYTRDLRELKATQAERDMERQLLKKIMDSAPI